MSGTLPPLSGHPNVTLPNDLASALFGFPSGWLPFFGLLPRASRRAESSTARSGSSIRMTLSTTESPRLGIWAGPSTSSVSPTKPPR